MLVRLIIFLSPRPDDEPGEHNPPEAARTYSSVWGNSLPGTGLAQSCLDSPLAWAAAGGGKQWMQIDLGRVWNVNGVVLQGRLGGQWVKKFDVELREKEEDSAKPGSKQEFETHFKVNKESERERFMFKNFEKAR